jgi:NADPH2:quinone reductase
MRQLAAWVNYLVQWLKHLKATVIGTVSTSAKADIARACGADHVIDYSSS